MPITNKQLKIELVNKAEANGLTGALNYFDSMTPKEILTDVRFYTKVFGVTPTVVYTYSENGVEKFRSEAPKWVEVLMNVVALDTDQQKFDYLKGEIILWR